MRISRLITAVLVVIVAAAGFFAFRFSRSRAPVRTELACLPDRPDLSRWPGEFRERLRTVTAEATRAERPVLSLGELARLYFANGFSAEAEKILRTLRELEPDNARWAWFLGIICQQRAASAEARAFFEVVIKLEPRSAPAWRSLARFAAAAGQPDLARSHFEQVLVLIPNDPEAVLALASIDGSRGDQASAIRRLEELLKILPRAYEARQQLAEIFEATGRKTEGALQRHLMEQSVPTPEARDSWMDELYLSSYDTFRLATTGGILLQDGQPKESLPYLVKAAALAPEDSNILTRLASNYLQLGKKDEARSILEKGLVRMPQEARLYVSLAELLIGESQAPAAIALLQRGIVHVPSDAGLQMALGLALGAANQFTAATEAFREALRLDPVLTEAQLNLGRCLLQTGRRAEGRSAVGRALEMRPEYTAALLLLARLDLEDRDYDAADLRAEKLLMLAPADRDVLDLYAFAKFTIATRLSDAGRPVEAEKLCRAGLAANPDYGRLHGALGLLMQKQGRVPEALTEMQRYAQLAPSEATAYLLLGDVQASLQNSSAARESYERGLAVARRADDRIRINQFEQRLAR